MTAILSQNECNSIVNENLNENANVNDRNKENLSINSNFVDFKKPIFNNFNYDENKKNNFIGDGDDEHERYINKTSKQNFGSINKLNSNGNSNENDVEIGSKCKPISQLSDNSKNYYLEDSKQSNHDLNAMKTKAKLNDEHLLNENIIDVNYNLKKKLKLENNNHFHHYNSNNRNDNNNYFNKNDKFLDEKEYNQLNYLKEDKYLLINSDDRDDRITRTTSYNNINNDKSNNISTDESLSITTSISNENLSDEEDCANENDEEFQFILKRINFDNINKSKEGNTNNNNNTNLNTSDSLNNNNNNDQSIKINNNNNNNNKNINPSLTIETLKYLYKLLKFYKLEHYMNDLIDFGYYTPISLNKLEQKDLDHLSISPYDKKKFNKLQLFIKQVMSTITKANVKNLNDNKTKFDENMFYQSQAFNNLHSTDNYNNNENLNEWKNKSSKANTVRKTYPTSNTINPKLYASSASKSARTQADKKAKEDFNNNIETNKNQNLLDYDDEECGIVYLNKKNTAKNIQHPKANYLYSSSSASINRPTWNEVKNKDFNQQQVKPLFSKNPNLIQNKVKPQRTIRPSASSNVNSKNTKSAIFTSKHPLVSNNKSKSISQSRAKSTDQIGNKQISNLTSKSVTVFDPNSVCHPASFKKMNKANENFFGPKLNDPHDIQNVEFVDRQTYNYGVPQTPNDAPKNKGYISKNNHKKLRSQSHHQFNSDVQLKSNITTADIFVYARKRPKLACEAQFNDAIVIEKSDSNNSYETTSVCVNEVKSLVDGTPVLRKNEFTFDRTFDSTFTNEDIFKTSIKPFIDIPYENRNDFTCICFGQTGSGKTHTLFGTKSQDGVCVLTAQALFSNNERLFCGFYEIYNGQLYDLINQNNRLVLREDSAGQLNVVGLVEVEIKSLNQLRKTIEIAQSNRHIGCTSFNKASSRSHAVIQFKVPNVSSSQSNSGHVILKNHNTIKSKVNSGLNNVPTAPKAFRVLFIDLAGSERGIDAQNNQNDNRKEGAEINQSLLALKECIRCMDQFYAHAPFRQSKLTRVLRDCFVGIGRTILIATVSPTEDCVSCSLNTLQYANRVRLMTLRNRKKNEKLYKNVFGQGVAAKSMSKFNSLGTTSLVKSTTNLDILQQTAQTTNLNKIDFSSSSEITSTNKSKTTANYKLNNIEDYLNQKMNDHTPLAYSNSIQKDKLNDLINHNNNKNEQFATNTKPLIKNSIQTTSSVPTTMTAVTVVAAGNSSSNNNNILPSKPYSKYQTISNPTTTNSNGKNNINAPKNVQSLFHPSKINMSSTPIKSNINNDQTGTQKNTEDFGLFENDTPIKGHKIKYISNGSSAIAQLAERYFTRTEQLKPELNKEVSGDKPDLNDKKFKFQTPTVNYYVQDEELNSKIYCKFTPKSNEDNEDYLRYTQNRKKYDLTSKMERETNSVNDPEFNRERYRINRHKNEEKESNIITNELNNPLNNHDLNLKSRNADLLKSCSANKDLISNLRYKANLMSNLIKTHTFSSRTSEWDENNNNYSPSITAGTTSTTTKNITSKTKISDKYMQRYRSIYSLESPPPLPCDRLPDKDYDDKLEVKPNTYSNPYEMKYFNNDLKKNPTTFNALKDFKSKNYDDILASHSSILRNKDAIEPNKNEQQNNVSLIEESLIRLRKKQRELLELRRLNNNKFSNNTSMDNTNIFLSSKLNDDIRSDATSFIFREDEDIDQLIENSNLFMNQLKINNNDSIDLIKRDSSSQRQLKVYIDALETKLNNLKKEMKEPNSLPNENGDKKFDYKANRERSVSSGSCDSLKEANGFTQFSNKSVYNEFIQRRRQLEKEHLEHPTNSHKTTSETGYMPSKNSLCSILNDLKSKKFDEDYEKLFIETQMQKQETNPNQIDDKLSNIKNGQNFEDSTDENNSDTDALKQSMHKGSSTDLLFSKAKRSSLTKADLPPLNEVNYKQTNDIDHKQSKICDFSPISHDNNDKIEINDNQIDKKLDEIQLTPRTQHQLVNPIPIRLSSSSSFDSTISKNNQLKAQQNLNDDYENQNSSRSLISSNDGNGLSNGLLGNLKSSNSKIWKAAKSASAILNNQQNEHNEEINRNTWSSILKECQSNGHKEDGLLNLHSNNNNNSLLSDCSSSNSNMKTKELLSAHEHQLSDIAETCKKEMNLLSCLKENQVNFDDYLSQVEEMLSKKAHSIRDLQNQITQLKTCHNQTSISLNPPSQEIN